MSMDDVRNRPLKDTTSTPDRPNTIAGGNKRFRITRLEERPNEADRDRFKDNPDWRFLMRPRVALGVQLVTENGKGGMFVQGRRGGNIEISPEVGADRDGKPYATKDTPNKLWADLIKLLDRDSDATSVGEFIDDYLKPAVNSKVFDGRFREMAYKAGEEVFNEELGETVRSKATYRTIKDDEARQAKISEYVGDGMEVYNTLEEIRWPKDED